MPYKISKKYSNTDWIDLDLLNAVKKDWTTGIDIIKDRFQSRFFYQIEQIKDDEFSGFAVMALDCLLIETLMQFYLGVNNTEVNYRGNQWEAFKDFFRNSSQFDQNFTTDNICKKFYVDFRCGLLHQAQTKGQSKIKVSQTTMISFINKIDEIDGLIIDRRIFHECLIQEFTNYLLALKNDENNFQGNNLRRNAITKMNFICNI